MEPMKWINVPGFSLTLRPLLTPDDVKAVSLRALDDIEAGYFRQVMMSLPLNDLAILLNEYTPYSYIEIQRQHYHSKYLIMVDAFEQRTGLKMPELWKDRL